jgi:hypothetical protein
MTAGAVAAIIIQKEKDLVAHFRAASATTPATAKNLAALGIEDGMVLKQLRRRAVIRESATGVYYLDDPAWAVLQEERRRVAWLVIVAVVALLIAVALIATAKLP